jgi:hypothetical protein
MLKKVGKVFKWGSAPNPGIFVDVIPLPVGVKD